MPKTKGQHNAGYEEKRRELLDRARTQLTRASGKYASLRDIAAACDVTLPTLRHYFGNRDGVIVAILEQSREEGTPHLAFLQEPSGPFERSVEMAVERFMTGLKRGLGDIISMGLAEGLREPLLGERFLELVLEPAVQATRMRLEAHIARGDMRDSDARSAALALVSPIFLAVLHQQRLGGADKWPMDVDRFAADHAAAFVRAYRIEG